MSLLRICNPGLLTLALLALTPARGADPVGGDEFFERRVRPMLIEHCYECHSEEAQEQQGGLLLDRRSGWIAGGDMGKAVVPGEAESSLLIAAVRYDREDLQMPPDEKLSPQQIEWFENWVRGGASSPEDDMGETEFSRLGDQDFLFGEAEEHWAFRPVSMNRPPSSADPRWDHSPIDRFVFARLQGNAMTPSPRADSRTLLRRLHYDATGLPPRLDDIRRFEAAVASDRSAAIDNELERLLHAPAFGQHIGRMWLDVARYADTDSAYRPDTRTPHYFPFAFTFRDYVVDSFNADKPYDRFVSEQLAADLMGLGDSAPELAALGFLAVGPHANRAQAESLDDWIDLTTRGLLGMTAACARCHDHKFEPIPTADYYSLRGVFAALDRVGPLDEDRLPEVSNEQASAADVEDYLQRRAKIEAKLEAAAGKKAGNNNRSIAQKIRETELAELLLRHPGAPARAMIVSEKKRVPVTFIHIRGDASARGEEVPRRFLEILDPDQTPFSENGSGRLELAARITDASNPLTARVFVNRVWGHLVGTHLVATPSDFGLQGSPPTHPQLLDWLAADFVAHDWSVKHLVRTILSSETYQQSAGDRDAMSQIDPENRLLWRANRGRLSIESLRDSMLAVSGALDGQLRGRVGELWGKDYTRRRAIYGFVNRFNLDPTLRAFDFPAPMQTQPGRGESIIAPQALFTMNSPFVIDQASAIVQTPEFAACQNHKERIEHLFAAVLQRAPVEIEIVRIEKFIELKERFKPSPRFIDSAWPLVAQSLLMSNEFQYVD
jgi:hypothetical protein